MDARATLPMGLAAGDRFGNYDVVRMLGSGASGLVYEATHRVFGSRIALKVMHPFKREVSEERARFLREGALLVRVEHPHVVAVYDAGEADGVPYVAMELLDGPTLDKEIATSGAMDPHDTMALLGPVAEGLSVVHDVGVSHRDVKPANILVVRDEADKRFAKLVDFGIAKDLRRISSNSALGSPSYMSPERLLGGLTVDGRSDQYSFGVTIYQTLTGVLPYVGRSLLDLAMQVQSGSAAAPSQHRAGIPPELDRLVLRAMSPQISARYPSMRALATAMWVIQQAGPRA